MTRSIKDFFWKLVEKESPLAIVMSIILIVGAFFAYIDRLTHLPSKVSSHTVKIQRLKERTNQQSKAIDRIKERTSDIRENQRIMICNSPNIGDYWKNKKSCGDFK